MTFDEKLTQALKESFEERVEQSISSPEKHRFSLSYRLWERKMLRDIRRNRVDKRWTLRRARYAVVAMFAAFTLLVGGTAYGAAKIRGFRFEENPKQTNLFLESYSTDKTTFEELYWLPEDGGWILTNCGLFGIDNNSLRLHFMRGDTLVIFYQNLIREYPMGHIFNEYPDIEMLSIYSENDGFITDHRGDGMTLGWLYDGYFFEILCDDMSKDELIELAHSITTITPEELLKYDDPEHNKYCKRVVQQLAKQT